MQDCFSTSFFSNSCASDAGSLLVLAVFAIVGIVGVATIFYLITLYSVKAIRVAEQQEDYAWAADDDDYPENLEDCLV